MEDNYNFELMLDGNALKKGEIDVRDLAPSLLALSDLVEQASNIVNGKNTKIDIRVKSDFRKGSFLVDLVSNVSHYQNLVDFFSSDEVQAWNTVAGLIGISGCGVFQFLQRSKGQKPERVVEVEHTQKVRVTFQGGDEAEFDKKVIELLNNRDTREAVEKVVEPLKKEGIDTFGFNQNSEETFRINEKEASYFSAPQSNDEKDQNTIDIVLKIVAPSFNPENKWRVSDGSRTIYASIADQKFKDRIATRKELFGSGDYLRCRLTTVQWFETGTLKSSYEIEEIYEHIASDQSRQIDIDKI